MKPYFHFAGKLRIVENLNQRYGLSSSLYVCCSNCKLRTYFNTSKHDLNQTNWNSKHGVDVNRRSTFAACAVGIGRETLHTICDILNMPPPVAPSAYSDQVIAIHDAQKIVIENRLADARRQREPYTNDPNQPVDVAVSFHGTWSKRGFTANFGIGFVISMDTGEVLD